MSRDPLSSVTTRLNSRLQPRWSRAVDEDCSWRNSFGLGVCVLARPIELVHSHVVKFGMRIERFEWTIPQRPRRRMAIAAGPMTPNTQTGRAASAADGGASVESRSLPIERPRLDRAGGRSVCSDGHRQTMNGRPCRLVELEQARAGLGRLLSQLDQVGAGSAASRPRAQRQQSQVSASAASSQSQSLTGIKTIAVAFKT